MRSYFRREDISVDFQHSSPYFKGTEGKCVKNQKKILGNSVVSSVKQIDIVSDLTHQPLDLKEV